MIDRRFRLTRTWSNNQLRAFAPFLSGHVVNISGADDEDKEGGHYRDYFSSAEQYSLTNFSTEIRGFRARPHEILLDLESASLDPHLIGAFDVGLCHTTLEHIFDIDRAFENLFSLCSRYVIIVVPFAQVEHGPPAFGDFWRFTPMGLESMIKKHGWEVAYLVGSDMTNAAIYLFVVAAANLDLAELICSQAAVVGRCPSNLNEDEALGSWIGAASEPTYRKLWRRIRKLQV